MKYEDYYRVRSEALESCAIVVIPSIFIDSLLMTVGNEISTTFAALSVLLSIFMMSATFTCVAMYQIYSHTADARKYSFVNLAEDGNRFMDTMSTQAILIYLAQFFFWPISLTVFACKGVTGLFRNSLKPFEYLLSRFGEKNENK